MLKLRERDKDNIRHQIDATLRAYIELDWERLRQTHTADWCGFAPESPAIIKGRAGLIAAAAAAPSRYRFRDYEMIEIDYRFFGDVCVVPYVARVRGTTADEQPFEARLQSICVYLKQQHAWQLSVSDFHLSPLDPAPFN